MILTVAGILIVLLSVGSLAQDSAKTPSLKDLWRLQDSVSRVESRAAEAPATASFIYIDDFEVRHEILMPFYALEDWVDLEYTDAYHIDTIDQQAMQEPIERFCTERLAIRIDGLPVHPVVTQIDFIAPQYLDSMQISRSEPIDAYTSWVGIILSYGTKGSPGAVEISWDMFGDDIPRVTSIVYAYSDRGEFAFLPDNATYRWENPGRPPIPPIDEIKTEESAWWQFWSSRLSEEDAGTIVETLVRNVYRAFDYRTESDVYDALALSVGGELLDDIYLQIRRSLTMQEQGGAVSRIKEVTVTNGRAIELSHDSFSYELQWSATGTVEHWGHIHARTNGYRAEFEVAVVDHAWRIVSMQVLNQKRLKFESTLRE